jgi:hypothetical protein
MWALDCELEFREFEGLEPNFLHKYSIKNKVVK